MTSYLGYDVLDQPENAREEPDDTMPRLITTFDPMTGMQGWTAQDRAPRMVRSYLRTCKTRAEIQSLKTWFSVRRGRLVPFWIPTWRRDLQLTLPVAPADGGITVEAHNYTKFMIDPTNARRHLSLASPARALAFRKVTDWHVVGATEVLTLNASVGLTLPVGSLISFLLFCRLASDDLTIRYLTDSIAECTFSYVEIPEEAP